jgi:hypothetical protein
MQVLDLAKESEPDCRVGVGERRQEQPPEQWDSTHTGRRKPGLPPCESSLTKIMGTGFRGEPTMGQRVSLASSSANVVKVLASSRLPLGVRKSLKCKITGKGG